MQLGALTWACLIATAICAIVGSEAKHPGVQQIAWALGVVAAIVGVIAHGLY